VDGNPDYSRAFKMDLDEQRGIGHVEEILWEISRHGKIIPRIKIKPLKIGGIVIQKATAFNAKYVKDHNLGPMAILNIIRSGDVIPYIESVIKEAPDGPSMPDVKYKWHPGGYDIYIDETEETDEIEVKQITYFMSTLEAEGISKEIIKRYYYDGGFKTIKSILNMTMDDLLKLPSTKEKSATKQLLVLEHIKTNEYPLETLMAASGVFGLGMGSRKVKLVIDTYPDIMTRQITKSDLIKIDGFEEKTATVFLTGLEKFKKWVIENKLYYDDPLKKSNQKKDSGKLDGMIFVMSGFRDKDLKKNIEDNGGVVTDAISSKTTVLIVKDLSESSTKIEKAKKLNIEIMKIEECKKKYIS
jgi:NAD-dependent DNA ligase